MLIATITTDWSVAILPVRRIKAAQLAVLRVLGEHVLLESIGQDMRGVYRITMPEPEVGEFTSKQHHHTIYIEETPE